MIKHAKKINIFLFSWVAIYAGNAPAPPAIPEVQAVSSNEKITLVWDNIAESSIDPLTGYSDFEGYRIYRSTDGGKTWGSSWRKIFNYSGSHVGWKPFDQFDLNEESDSLHCIYKNGYYSESSELCYSNAIPYESVASNLLENSDVIIEDSLVYLPTYIRGYCPNGKEHIDGHKLDDLPHDTRDCLSGGKVSSFDPMANWINLGENEGLKRTFIDTDVHDGVQYTYAVTAYDIGMKSFNVEYLSAASENSNDICDIDDLLSSEYDEKKLLAIEGYCESLPSCTFIDNKCKYSDENYCNGNDSYCHGMECCGEGGCCKNDNEIVDYNKEDCNLLSGINNHIWLPDTYKNKITCEEEGFTWQGVDHGFEDYSYPELCEDAGHDWIVVEYLKNDSCVAKGYEWKIIYFIPDTTWSSWNPGHFPGLEYADELWGYPSFESPKLFESFTDYNINGICDYDAKSASYEPFTDIDESDANNNGLCDEVGDWTIRCPEMIDNCNNDTNSDDIINGDDDNCCINVKVVEAGYKASNITYPDDTPDIEFIVPDSDNRGNGDRLYNIVNEYDLPEDQVILRFEINAGLDPDSYGDSNGSFATLNPGLFIYEVISLDNLTPKITSDISIQSLGVNGLDSLLKLPGVTQNSSTTISMPEYKIEDFKLTAVDNPLFEANYTDWFDGIQFRFDNGPNRLDNFSSVVLKKIQFSDTLLKNVIEIKMRYKSPHDLQKRLMYRYEIEFNTSMIDTAFEIAPLSACDHLPGFKTLLPFKITNLTTGKQVLLEHSDNGIAYGLLLYGEASTGGGCIPVCGQEFECIERKCVKKMGFNDCTWEYNELVSLTDTVYTTNNLVGSGEKVFQIKINFNYLHYALSHIPNFFQLIETTGVDWTPGTAYGSSDIVWWEGMLYKTNIAVEGSIPPNLWFDEDDDNVNDSPWQMLYPWKDGDSIIIEPYAWYQDGDGWVADLSVIGALDGNSSDDLLDISVVPNPYIVNSNYFNESPDYHLLRFTRLPTKCTINIYTVSGEFVIRLDHNDPFDSNEWWNVRNGSGKEVAPGLYIYVVEAPGVSESKIGKFAIIR